MRLLSDAATLARKDLLVELRARQALASAAALAAIALVVVALAVGPEPGRLRSLAPAVVWIALLYAALAVAERFERIDRADDAFSGLWLVLDDRRAIYLARVISLSTVLAILQLTVWIVAVLLLDVDFRPEFVALVPLSGLTAVAAGSATALIVALVADAAHRSLLLPVALLPLLVPTFLAGVQASSGVLSGSLTGVGGWVSLLLIETALFGGLGLLTFETAANPQ